MRTKTIGPATTNPEVGIVTVQPTAVPVVTELPGRTNAFLVAQVRARVDGIVLRREFTEGSEVKAGQRLYKIDPAPYIATLNSAKATLAKAQANLVSVTAQANRYKVLVAANAVSKRTTTTPWLRKARRQPMWLRARQRSIPRRSTWVYGRGLAGEWPDRIVAGHAGRLRAGERRYAAVRPCNNSIRCTST